MQSNSSMKKLSPWNLVNAIAIIMDSNSNPIVTYALLLHHCADHGLLPLGRQLHARLLLHSVTPSNFLASKLLAFYSRSNLLHDARNVFDGIPHKNLFAYNAMLAAYSFRSPSQSPAFFSSLASSFKPDAFSLSSLLKSSPPPRSIRGIHAFALRNGWLDADLFVTNGLVTAYSKSDNLVSARLLFDAMPDRDVVSWNSIISAYSHSGRYEDCLLLYREMAKGFIPNGVTVASVLHACAQLQDLVFGMEIHRFAVENGIEMDNVVWNSIIGFYAKCGSLEYARLLFDEMPGSDAVSYNTMISGYMAYGFIDKAVHLFRQITNPVISTWNAVIAGLVQNNRHSGVFELVRSMQVSGFRLNSVTISSVLPAISFYSNLLLGKQVHCYAIRNDCDQNVYVATAMIDIYAKAGFVDGAHRVFDGTKERSVIVWTAIISAFSSHGDAGAALSMFERMLESGTRPDPVTFTAVLAACAHAGAVDEARHIFQMMSEFKISPEIEQYACMVGVLSRCGMLKEAVDFIKNMPMEPNAKMWGAVLNGAAVFRDADLGKFVFEKLVEIEPENTGNYIVMANLYSGAERWDEAKMVREKMSKVGLAKIPGCSWIEMSNGLQVFVARDMSNGRTEEIYTVLDSLVGLMREEGYTFKGELNEESS